MAFPNLYSFGFRQKFLNFKLIIYPVHYALTSNPVSGCRNKNSSSVHSPDCCLSSGHTSNASFALALIIFLTLVMELNLVFKRIMNILMSALTNWLFSWPGSKLSLNSSIISCIIFSSSLLISRLSATLCCTLNFVGSKITTFSSLSMFLSVSVAFSAALYFDIFSASVLQEINLKNALLSARISTRLC